MDRCKGQLAAFDRTEQLDAIRLALHSLLLPQFALRGRMSKKQCAALVAALEALPTDTPRILLATGQLVGEGFDHPPLDTLVLAMPVSWKGTLLPHAGRLYRGHAGKADARIMDFVNTGHPALLRMWDKRQRGYRAIGYRMAIEVIGGEGELADVPCDRLLDAGEHDSAPRWPAAVAALPAFKS